jgi:peroxiredoxin Q/BCP
LKLLLLLITLLLAWLGWGAFRTGTRPLPGTLAPEFRLADQHGKTHQLSDYTGRWLVLYFYPKDDTPGCTREACAFRDGLAKLQAAGASVLGISVDSASSHARFAQKYQLNFSLLADEDGSVSRRYGTLMDWKIYRMSRRVTFLISPEGKIQQAYSQVDPTRHADEILADLGRAA